MRALGSLPCSHTSRAAVQHINPAAIPSQQLIARFRIVARSVDDTTGVAELLARDRRAPKVQPELLDDKSAERFITAQDASTSSSSSSSQGDVVKSRRKRREDMAAAVVAATGQPEAAGPKKCKEAIDRGLALFQEKKYQEAIAMFNLALELPGNGAYRLPGSPREYSCPSDAEENAALYNMACAYVQLGQSSSAITCLEAVLDNGFTDYATMRQDSDLQQLGQALQDLVGRYDSPVVQATKNIQGMFNNLMGNKKELVSDTEKKPWIMW